MFSEPQLLGQFAVGSSGILNTSVKQFPVGTSACQHTVQIVGTLASGQQVAADLGVWVMANPYPFGDTAAASPHGPAIGCLASLGIVEGFGSANYRADSPVSGGQAATAIARYRKLAAGVSSFANTPGMIHAQGIGALEAAGYINETFRPNAPMTRGLAASLLARVYNLEPAATSFADVGTTNAGAIGALVDAGVITGFADGSFRPDAPITRGQLASLLVRADYQLG